jgi:endonuclease YncB( thermonuclease family)
MQFNKKKRKDIMKKILFILMFAPLLAIAKPSYGPYMAEFIRVVDGDTLWMRLHVYPGQTNTIKIRLNDIDTPEKRNTRHRKVPQCEKQLAKKASEFTQEWVKGKQWFVVSDITTGVYVNRLLGNISYQGENLRQLLFKAKHARKYIDKVSERLPWCFD